MVNREICIGMVVDAVVCQYPHKTVDLEDETNIIERVIEKCFWHGGFAIFNIIALDLHILMRLCVDKYHPLATIVRG